MIYAILCLLFCLIALDVSELKENRCVNMDEPMRPAILTQLIKDGKIAEAQSKAFVEIEDFRDVISYSGFFEVNKEFESNLFFWYFPSQADVKSDPVILWLQGGPGLSSLIGLFMESGPFELPNRFDIKLRAYSWICKYSIVYVDCPVGAGYSFTKKNGYAENQTVIANELQIALRQFFKLFPDTAENDFYILAESYGAKYAISLAELIHNSNPKRKKQINLKGVMISSGFCDPINQIAYGDYLHEVGLLDHNARERFYFLENCIKEHIKNKNWVQAYETFDYLIAGDRNKNTLFQNLTGLTDYYNYVFDTQIHKHLRTISYYLELEELRRALHVGVLKYNITAEIVADYLKADMMKSVINSVPPLLHSYKFLFCNGQLDIITGYDMMEDALYRVNREKNSDFQNASSCIWRVDDDVAGYVKTANNLTQVLVRNAGHMLPYDQPKWSFDMIVRFIENRNFCV